LNEPLSGRDANAKIATETERFEFTHAIAVEGYRNGFTVEVMRGRVYPRDHSAVVQNPEFWRLLGPRPDELEEVNVRAG
jgi:hypothetical protein